MSKNKITFLIFFTVFFINFFGFVSSQELIRCYNYSEKSSKGKLKECYQVYYPPVVYYNRSSDRIKECVIEDAKTGVKRTIPVKKNYSAQPYPLQTLYPPTYNSYPLMRHNTFNAIGASIRIH